MRQHRFVTSTRLAILAPAILAGAVFVLGTALHAASSDMKASAPKPPKKSQAAAKPETPLLDLDVLLEPGIGPAAVVTAVKKAGGKVVSTASGVVHVQVPPAKVREVSALKGVKKIAPHALFPGERKDEFSTIEDIYAVGGVPTRAAPAPESAPVEWHAAPASDEPDDRDEKQ